MNPAPPTPVTDAELNALVDGELSPERAAEVEAWLLLHPAEAERVAGYRRLNQQLCEHFEPLLHAPAPERLLRAGEPPRRRLPWGFAAALLLALGLGGVVGGWLGRGAAPLEAMSPEAGEGFAHRARVAHAVYTPEQRRPVEVDGQHEEALVKWLSKRLGSPLRAPQLQTLGYALEGGRLLPGGQGPVAQFMYRDAQGARLTLYVTNEPGPAAAPRGEFRFLEDGAVRTFYWTEAGFGYALTAGTDRQALSAVAQEVYRQLGAVAASSP